MHGDSDNWTLVEAFRERTNDPDTLFWAGEQNVLPSICCRLELGATNELQTLLGNPALSISRFEQDAFLVKCELAHLAEQTFVLCRASKPKVVDAIARLGLPLHFALLRDSENSAKERSWAEFRPVWEAWRNGWHEVPWRDGGHLEFEADAVPIPEIEAYWLWRHIFLTADSDVLGNYTVSTNVAFVDAEDDDSHDKGLLGRLSVRLVRLDSSIQSNNPDAHGFIRNPRSFGYLLDADFKSAFKNTYAYLGDGAASLNIWPKDIAVEWDISPGSHELEGASAGAAIALAAGNVLARRHQYCLAHPEECQ